MAGWYMIQLCSWNTFNNNFLFLILRILKGQKIPKVSVNSVSSLCLNFLGFHSILSHSWCVHTDCSRFLHQFFGYIGGVIAKWILFLNLVLPALPKYASGPWTLAFSSKLWSASLFNEALHISAFDSLGVYFFLLTGSPYPTISLHALFQS